MTIESYRDASAGERARIGDQRDKIADEREAIADAREAAWTRWEAKCHAITTAADLRDQRADERDTEAHRRDTAAETDECPGTSDGGQAIETPMFARRDRAHAKANRIASAVDRFQLTFFTPSSAERRAAAKRRIAAKARAQADAMRHNLDPTQQPKRALANKDTDPNPG
jgi:hypothetical protein